MELNFFQDILFDLINESNALNVADIESDNKNHTFRVFMPDGSVFHVVCSQTEQGNKAPCIKVLAGSKGGTASAIQK